MAPPSPPRWLHAWAVLTVALTLPLLFLGAEVTSKQAGMSDPVGYRHPWQIVQLLASATGLGLQIEYSHRLAGFIVGTCTIVLAVGLWLFDRRRVTRYAGALALALVVIQGLLGKYRVDLDALFGPNLALVHGCFAQLVIATLISVTLFTSRGWIDDSTETAASPALRHWSIATVLLVYAQLVLGGVLRHRDFVLGSRLHLLGAFMVLGGVLWLIKLARESERRGSLALSVKLLAGLVALQLAFGVEAWLSRAHAFFVPGEPLPVFTDWVRSGHYVAGTLIFATTVVIALKANRRPVVVENAAPARVLEGAL
jgi:heme A synthase